MTTVTVELEDLKALVYATGAMKAIEAAILQAKRDPFAAPHIKSSHDRVANAVRHAERSARSGETAVAWDAPLEPEELKVLRRIADPGEALRRVRRSRAYEFCLDELSAKGMIDIGGPATCVLWAGDSQASELVVDPAWLAVRITERGRSALKEADSGQSLFDRS